MAKPKLFTHVPPQYADPHTDLRILFVGEAPGDNETIDGIPLVGQSGKLYNRLLNIANIDRTTVSITNVFDQQLPHNDVKNWSLTTTEKKELKNYDLPAVCRAGASAYWLKPEHHWHLDRLADEVAKANPNVIVTLGATALWAFTGYLTIEKRRGAVHEASMVSPGTKILPTYHPAYLFHSYHLFPLVVCDFLKARTECEYPEIRTTPREIWIEPTLDDIREFKAKYLDNAIRISIDIETPYMKLGLSPIYRQMKCISFAPDAHQSLVVPLIDERQPSKCYWKSAKDETEALRLIKEICENQSYKTGQNFGTFDMHWLYEIYGIGVRNYRVDTRLLQHVNAPELPKDLGTLGSLYANERAWKTMRVERSEKRDE